MKLQHKLAAAMTAAGGLCLLRSEYERDQISVECYELYSQKITGKEKTFVFLTDLHDKEFGMGNERLLAAVRAAQPDAVLCGGDMITAKGKAVSGVSVSLLCALAKEFPVYCANGNHEERMRRETHYYGTQYREYREILEKSGVCYLTDRGVKFGDDCMIYGLDLTRELYGPGRHAMKRDYIGAKLGAVSPDRYSILLAHSPAFFPQYASWGADLTLAGHFHGGTIRLPVLGGVMTSQYQFFHPWSAGLFVRRNRQGRTGRMIVGRGLGTHSINIRFNNKPQVIVVKIKK